MISKSVSLNICGVYIASIILIYPTTFNTNSILALENDIRFNF